MHQTQLLCSPPAPCHMPFHLLFLLEAKTVRNPAQHLYLAIYLAVDIEGHNFRICTDHKPLTYALGAQKQSGIHYARSANWTETFVFRKKKY